MLGVGQRRAVPGDPRLETSVVVAELAILPSDRSGIIAPKSGDTLIAMPTSVVEDAALFRIAHPSRAPRLDGSDLLVADGVSWDYHLATRAKLIEALSRDEIRITDLVTMESHRESYDARGTVARRRRSGLPIWGTPLRPRWFVGSRRPLTAPRRDALWQRVETDSPLRRAQHRRWPWTDREKRILLLVPVREFDELARRRAMAPDEDLVENLSESERFALEVAADASPTESVVVRYRRRRVPWEDLVEALGVTVEDVRRLDRVIDPRDAVEDLDGETIVIDKGDRNAPS